MKASKQPSSPSEWQIYASADALRQIPLSKASSQKGGLIFRQDVYFDVSDVLTSKHDDIITLTDVLALNSKSLKVNLESSTRTVQLYTRVVTSSTPVHLDIEAPKKHGGAFSLYCSVLDQPITWSFNGGDSTAFNLGANSGNVGVVLVVKKGKIKMTYKQSYGDLVDDHPKQLPASLKTQLRIASILFWQNPPIALSIASHIASAAADTTSESILKAQANTLGQQIVCGALAGSNASYAPTLRLESYQQTLNSALDAASAYQTQYNRFVDKETNTRNQIDAWRTMLEHSQGSLRTKEMLCSMTLTKYQSACKVVNKCQDQLNQDQSVIEYLQTAFQDGIKEWKEKLEREAVIKILTGLVMFAVAIGAMCIGDPAAGSGGASAPAEAEKAIVEIEEAEKLGDKLANILKSDTVKKLKKCISQMGKLLSSFESIINGIDDLIQNGSFPGEGDVGGTSGINGTLDTIVSMASWDKWTLESDDQLRFAVDQNINGATDYRLALRKHAINGKVLAQAQAQVVKAGQEYVESRLSINAIKQDTNNLQLLLDSFKQQEEEIECAQALLYDQLMTVRTSVAIELRSLIWAYKFYTLEESSVSIDLWKPIEEYRIDALTIQEELQNADSRFAGDYQPYKFKVYSTHLPPQYQSSIIESLKGPDHTATFTLSPIIRHDDKSTILKEFAGPFIGGSHFRVDGLEVILQGARPEAKNLISGLARTRLTISTSGVYADVNKSEVFHFHSLPLIRRYEYYMTEDGSKKSVIVHSSFKTTTHVQPTAFTQWTIKIDEPENLILDNLSGVLLKWTGTAYFD
ncbi:hypothetical protein EAE96_000118 [Botrytis aclada]|nr:hypothetical protein EAE96_000118 [Botrytis aclada]